MTKQAKLNPLKDIRVIGEETLRNNMKTLDIEELKLIIRCSYLDASHTLTTKNKKDRNFLINFIMERTISITNYGTVFRNATVVDKGLFSEE